MCVCVCVSGSKLLHVFEAVIIAVLDLVAVWFDVDTDGCGLSGQSVVCVDCGVRVGV